MIIISKFKIISINEKITVPLPLKDGASFWEMLFESVYWGLLYQIHAHKYSKNRQLLIKLHLFMVNLVIPNTYYSRKSFSGITYNPTVQCPAVRTHPGLIKVPPQKLNPDFSIKAAWYLISPSLASLPWTILPGLSISSLMVSAWVVTKITKNIKKILFILKEKSKWL